MRSSAEKLKVGDLLCLARGAFELSDKLRCGGYVPYSLLRSNMTDAVHRLLSNFYLALVISNVN